MKLTRKNQMRARRAVLITMALVGAVAMLGGDDAANPASDLTHAPDLAAPSPLFAFATLDQRQKHVWPLVGRLARSHGLEPELIMGVIQVESRFNPLAISGRGAIGLMQITPRTCAILGLDNPLDPKANLAAGAKYLKKLLVRFRGNTRMALAAYNAGPTRVENEGKIPAIKETRNFVHRVLKARNSFRVRYGALAQR